MSDTLTRIFARGALLIVTGYCFVWVIERHLWAAIFLTWAVAATVFVTAEFRKR